MTPRPLPDEVLSTISDLDAAHMDRLAATWDRLPEAPSTSTLGVPTDDEAWTELQVLIQPAQKPGRQDRHAIQRPRRTRWVRIVATAAVVGIGLWLGLPREQFVSTVAGETQLAELPDGSLIHLYGESSLAYRSSRIEDWLLGWTSRSTELVGEGFFDVRSGSAQFQVFTHDARVEVLGTQFLVRSRPMDMNAATLVSVTEGSVRVESRHTTYATQMLTSGEAVVVSNDRAEAVRAVAETGIGIWRDGGFAVQNLPLADVAREVERRFGSRIILAEGVPHEQTLTLFYGAGVNARVVMHDIALAAGLRYRVLQGGFELVPSSEQ